MTRRKEKQAVRSSRRVRELRIQALLKSGRIESAFDIPEDAIPAARELQNTSGTWSPPLYYRDYPFICKDCGRHEVWTAGQQRWYYEVVKGSVLGSANRCRPCRRKRREEVERQRSLLRAHQEKKQAMVKARKRKP